MVCLLSVINKRSFVMEEAQICAIAVHSERTSVSVDRVEKSGVEGHGLICVSDVN